MTPQTGTKSGGPFDLVQQFSFYGSYHTNPVNILIHIICVPSILTSALVLAHYFGHPSLASLPVPSLLAPYLGPLVDVTPTFLVAAAYATYFVLLEPVAGALYAPFLLAIGHFTNVFYDTNEDAIKIAGAVFVAAWVFQFIGHGKFEGRAPALFDSLLQSLVLAVFFVFLEVLFTLGYRPALHKKLQNEIGKQVLEYRQCVAAKKRAQ